MRKRTSCRGPSPPRRQQFPAYGAFSYPSHPLLGDARKSSRMEPLPHAAHGKLRRKRQSPAGWLGLYAATCFRTACALFGCGRKEEGYICLERAFELFRQWADIPDGTEMEAGKAFVFGGVRLVKGKGVLLLPDGSREPFEECSLYGTRIDLPYYGMTAPSGWEWFDSVRGEERFRAFVERAKALAVNGK